VANDRQPTQGSWLLSNRRAAIAATLVPFLLLGFLEYLPGTFFPAIAYFAAAGIWALYAVSPRVPMRRRPFVGALPSRCW
jgi:hypothetical protein